MNVLRRILLPVSALLFIFTSCFDVATRTCSTGLVCPLGTVCSGDGTTCIGSTATCGNGVVDPGEKCDDGNVVNDATCRFDCRGTGQCGDGTTDSDLLDSAGKPLEACDDGNLVGVAVLR